MNLNHVIVAVLMTSTVNYLNGESVQRIAYDYTSLYEALAPNIVKVETDSSSGSGFLVDKRGLIATNHHVVQNTRFLAVQFSDGTRVNAELFRISSRFDLALLKVHENHTINLTPLQFISSDDEQRIKAGQPVVAFGSPLSLTFLVTQGIVSKVEETTLLGDFLLEAGNSGGPLVNLQGQVIGVNTFGLRGIGGAVRIGLLRDILNKLSPEDLTSIDVSSKPLRTFDERIYPAELLKTKILLQDINRNDYSYGTEKFKVTILTPVLTGIRALQDQLDRAANRYKRRGRKIHDSSYRAMNEPFYDWHRDATPMLRLRIRVHIQPKITETWASKILRGFDAVDGTIDTPATLKYKGEFFDFQIYRDGELIEPVRPGRYLAESSRDDPLARFIDEAYTGLYEYAPDDFLIGNDFRFLIYEANRPEKAHHEQVFQSDSKLISQIQSDFREALGEGRKYWEDDVYDSSNISRTGVIQLGQGPAGFSFRKGSDGLNLLEVFVGSPAYRAGLRTGDVLLNIDGTDPTTVRIPQLFRRIRRGNLRESVWTVRHRGAERIIRVIEEHDRR